MESALVSLICIALILMGIVTMARGSFSAMDIISGSWKEAQAQTREISQTGLSVVGTLVSPEDKGSRVEITIRNGGGVPLADFDRWDVIIHYQEGDVAWLPYNESPGWTGGGIFFGDSPEVFEPNILNPGEEMVLILDINPVSKDSTNQVTIVTANGVGTAVMFEAGTWVD